MQIARPDDMLSSRQQIVSVAAAVAAAAALYAILKRDRREQAVNNLIEEAAASPPANSSSQAAPPPPPEVVHILHSGGFASEVSAMIKSAISTRAAACECHMRSMDQFKKWMKECAFTERSTPLHVLFVVSTIENEQPPEEAQPCVLYLKRKIHPPDLLSGRCKYAVLGLGDSNLLLDRQTTTAKDCNQVADRLDTRLAALGAERLHPCGQVDDRTGNQELEPFIASLVATLF